MFLGAITLVATFPFIVEAGIFLDIVAGVLIMVVFVSGLTRQLAEASAARAAGAARMTALAILIALGPLAGPAAALAGARARLAVSPRRPERPSRSAARSRCWPSLDGGRPLHGWDGFLYVDSLGGFFLLTVAGVTLLAALGSISYVAAQEDERRAERLPGPAVLLVLRPVRLADAGLAGDRQPRAALRPGRGEHAGQRRAGRPGRPGPVAGGGLEVRDHQLAGRHDRAGGDAVPVLLGQRAAPRLQPRP